MPKALVLGNGNILLCFDRYGQLRDFYYHYIGLENHVGHGCVNRIGVMIDGCFTWLEDPTWEVSLAYNPDALSSQIKAINREQGIELDFCDLVYNEKNIFLRQVKVTNLFGYQRQLKIFFHQQFRIYDTSRRDTGYYDPEKKIIIHYEGRRVFAIGARCGDASFDDYSVGNYGIEGKEGTWKDAEDGILGKNPIEHGAVDSVMAFTHILEENGSCQIDYWITAGKSIEEATGLHECVLTKTPAHIRETTQDFWHAWINKTSTSFADLEEDIIDFYRKSLFIARTHIGYNGDIIASGDSDMLQYGKDTYAYVWPRDAAFVTIAFDRAGYSNITRMFFDFCNEVISKEGYFYHKYRCDRSVGSSWHPWSYGGKKRLAIQEDETALIIYALWRHYQANFDIEFIEGIYNSLVKKAAEFMCRYIHKTTGLPQGSYDIWEQDFATSTFTCSTVYGGLIAASKFANILGKEEDYEKYKKAAQGVREAIIKYLYNKEEKYFYKAVQVKRGKLVYDDRIDMSSFHGIVHFKVLDKDDQRVKDAFDVVKQRLTDQTPVGGVIRYEGDEFHRVSVDEAANPWFITTFWKAQYEIRCAKNRKELAKVKDTLRWAMRYASPAGIMSEQLSADSGEQISAAPLSWSHAEFIATVLDYAKKYKEFKKDDK